MQKQGGSVVSITTSMLDHPIAGVTASVPMMTKGGIESISKNLAMEYAKEGIRLNTVAPGVVDTPLHKDNPKDCLRTLSPMGSTADTQEIVDAEGADGQLDRCRAREFGFPYSPALLWCISDWSFVAATHR